MKCNDPETAICTICSSEPSPGFYAGCLIADGHGDGRWLCDGKGNLTRTNETAMEAKP